MVEEKVKTFTESVREYLREFWSERIGELYGDLEKTDEFKELSAKEDKLYDKLNENLCVELQETFFDYSNTVEQKFVQYRGFYHKRGFSDFGRTEKQSENLPDDCLDKRVKQHFEALEKQEEFKKLSVKEETLYSTLKSGIPQELLETLLEFGNVVQRKYAQYQTFYYREGFRDCAEYLRVCTGNALWILGLRKDVKIDLTIV